MIFSGLLPGTQYVARVSCKFQGMSTVIRSAVAIPPSTEDCYVRFTNGRYSVVNYTTDGDAMVEFSWDSTGDPVGFRCRIDREPSFRCEYQPSTVLCFNLIAQQ